MFPYNLTKTSFRKVKYSNWKQQNYNIETLKKKRRNKKLKSTHNKVINNNTLKYWLKK